MKILGIILAAIIACVVMIMPISAFMVRQGFKHKEKASSAKLVFRGADIRRRLSQYGTAAKIMEKGLETFPRYPERGRITYRIGLCYEKGGKPQIAKRWYQTFKEQFPKHEWVPQADVRIQRIDAGQ